MGRMLRKRRSVNPFRRPFGSAIRHVELPDNKRFLIVWLRCDDLQPVANIFSIAET